MNILYGSYNIPFVNVNTPVSTGTNTIGTASQYHALRAMVENSGMFMGIMTMGMTVLKGTMTCNIADGGIEAYTVTNENSTFRILLMYIYPQGTDCKMDVTVKELS